MVEGVIFLFGSILAVPGVLYSYDTPFGMHSRVLNGEMVGLCTMDSCVCACITFNSCDRLMNLMPKQWTFNGGYAQHNLAVSAVAPMRCLFLLKTIKYL
jgi:hypothetical protein